MEGVRTTSVSPDYRITEQNNLKILQSNFKIPEGNVIFSSALCCNRSFPSLLNKKTEKALWRIPLGVSEENTWQLNYFENKNLSQLTSPVF